jgi:hypothetical protein
VGRLSTTVEGWLLVARQWVCSPRPWREVGVGRLSTTVERWSLIGSPPTVVERGGCGYGWGDRVSHLDASRNQITGSHSRSVYVLW